MGQSLACCSNSNIDNNDIKTNDFKNDYQRLKTDKLYLIIRLQAAFRGYLARKHISSLRATNYGNGTGLMGKAQMSPNG